MPRCTLLAASVIASACPVWADAPLVWKLSPGDELAMESRQQSESTLQTKTGEVASKTSQTVTLSWKVVGVGEEGAASVEQDIRRIELSFDAPGGQSYQFDTDAEEPPQGLASMIAPLYEAMAENNLEFTLSPRGKIVESNPPEPVLQTLKNLPGAAALGKGGEVYQQLLRPAVMEFPLGHVAIGQEWSHRVDAPLAMGGVGGAVFHCTYLGERDVDGRTLAAIRVTLALAPPAKAVPAPEGPAPDIPEPGAPAPLTTQQIAKSTSAALYTRQPDQVARDPLPPAEEGARQLAMKVTESDGEVLFDRQAGRVHSASLSSKFDMTLRLGEQPTTGKVTQTISIKALAPQAE